MSRNEPYKEVQQMFSESLLGLIKTSCLQQQVIIDKGYLSHRTPLHNLRELRTVTVGAGRRVGKTTNIIKYVSKWRRDVDFEEYDVPEDIDPDIPSGTAGVICPTYDSKMVLKDKWHDLDYTDEKTDRIAEEINLTPIVSVEDGSWERKLHKGCSYRSIWVDDAGRIPVDTMDNIEKFAAGHFSHDRPCVLIKLI